jgi:hypothetical protein
MKQTCLIGVDGALIGATALQASAFDLTGTWQGEQVCKVFTSAGQREKQEFENDIIAITQIGTEVRISMPAVNLLYTGLGFNKTSNTNEGEVTFRLCGITQNPTTEGEMGRAEVGAKSLSLGGKFKATSIFSDGDEVDTCDWNYERISMVNPNVPACP